jgi:glycosyltransferase involved in cell wall biosynthesis
MRILAMAHAYVPGHNAGAETTLHALLRHLAARGHDVHVVLSRPMAGFDKDYIYAGVQVHPWRGDADVVPYFTHSSKRADVVIAHLENTMRAAALADIYKMPMVHVIHNTHQFTKGAFRRGPCQLAVFNSHWMHDDFAAFWRVASRTPMPPAIVVHPPVDPTTYVTTHGQKITLINLNEDKGGRLFWQLADAMPQRKFLAVKGAYGEQIIPDTIPPNVEVVEHQQPRDMAIKVYSETKVLLMPSSYESYGRCAVEAAYSGIPTIAHPTLGLQEALGRAGTFVDRGNLPGWISAIKYLTSPRGFSNASQRAKAHAEGLDPTADLDRFADAIEGVRRRGFATVTR